jgi:lantibiotic modifying enzyme
LYSGNSGILLFYLELAAATHDKKFMDIAGRAADHLAATVPATFDVNSAGLYTGQAGLIYALRQADLQIGKKTYRDAVARLLDGLAAFVKDHANDPEAANDIVYGWAGIGLSFLYAEREHLRPDAGQLAQSIGRILLGRQVRVTGGVRWPMFMADTARGFYMPNFSHGTAGVAYFMARLYEVHPASEYLDAAVQAGAYLLSITSPNGMIRHAEPDPAAMDRFYVSWCHGPVGTARLYHVLWKITQEEKWKVATMDAARADMVCGIPEKHSAGFWNNVSFCCGNAGMAVFYLDMYKMKRDQAYLDFANKVLDDLVKKADVQGNAWQWVQAENRRQPEFLQAQTGLMQGAAGIGLAFLRADALRKGRLPLVRLPDDPF